MRRKIYASMFVIALVAALVGGATFALFTDTATNANNTFSAGTVDLTVGEQQYSVGIGNMAPGDVNNGSFTIQNSGTLKMWYRVTAQTSGDLFSGNTPAIVNPSNTGWQELDPGASTTFDYTVSLPTGANNDYQGATGSLSFTVEAQQYANNPTP